MLSRKRWWVRRLAVVARVQGGNVEVCWHLGAWASVVPSRCSPWVGAGGTDECCAMLMMMMMRVTYTCCFILNGDWYQWQRQAVETLAFTKAGKKDIYGLIVVTSKLLYGSNMLLPTLLYRSILGSRCVPIFNQFQHKASWRMLDSKIRGVQKCEALHANRVFSLFEAYYIRNMHIGMFLNIRPSL